MVAQNILLKISFDSVKNCEVLIVDYLVEEMGFFCTLYIYDAHRVQKVKGLESTTYFLWHYENVWLTALLVFTIELWLSLCVRWGETIIPWRRFRTSPTVFESWVGKDGPTMKPGNTTTRSRELRAANFHASFSDNALAMEYQIFQKAKIPTRGEY